MAPAHRAQTIALVIIATVLVGYVLVIGAGILQPLVIALLLANVLQPVVRSLEKLHIPGAVTVLLLSVLLFWAFFRTGILVQENLAALVRETGPSTEVITPQDPWDKVAAGLKAEVEANQELTLTQKQDFFTLLQGADLPMEPQEDPALVLKSARVRVEGLVDSITALAGWPVTDQAMLSEHLQGVDLAALLNAETTQQTSWALLVEGLVERVARQEYLSDEVKATVSSTIRDFDIRPFVAGLIGTGITFTRTLVVILIYMAFIFAEQNVFRRKILAVAGARGPAASDALVNISRNVQRYLSVKTLISLITGLLCFFLLIAADVPYAPIFAVLTFALNFIPTFGSIIAGLLAALVALAVHPSWVPAAVVATGYAMVNLGLGSFLEPRILGRELNISPLVIIISVVVWAGIWGIVGAFLAVPLTAAIQIVLASSERGRPIAILLSGRPPVEGEDGSRRPRLPLARRRRTGND